MHILSKGYVLQVFTNPSPQAHYFTSLEFAAAVWTRKMQTKDAEIKGAIREAEVLPKGGVEWFFVPVQTGTFSLYCHRPGHREAGMVGTITVRSFPENHSEETTRTKPFRPRVRKRNAP